MKFIAYDLGTGGVKASLYNESLDTLEKVFIEYSTSYPAPDFHEQRPDDWWQGVILSTKELLAKTHTPATEVSCVALSGHSLVTVPMDSSMTPLLEYVPIWSDKRAAEDSRKFFQTVDEQEWYMSTGNGFPAPCYSIFKLMWLKKKSPDLFYKIDKVLGSKDYINFKLTGKMYTDYSYASGLGAYNLGSNQLDDNLLNAAGIPSQIFPPIVSAHTIIGSLTQEAALATGLSAATKVACGGVDNACMALGAVGSSLGDTYTSLGSSSWIAVNAAHPVLDARERPYTFSHIEDHTYTSAFSIFSGGSSFRWVRDNLCIDLLSDADPYGAMTNEILKIPAGSNGIFFVPSLAGGTSQDKSIHIRGGFAGLHLGTTRADMVHAAMEGIALNLRLSLDSLGRHTPLSENMQFCGGGSKNQYWMQMFADVFNKVIIKTNIDQDAASLGAAAIAARATGLLTDYSQVKKLHRIEFKCVPDQDNVLKYDRLLPVFSKICDAFSDIGDFTAKAGIL